MTCYCVVGCVRNQPADRGLWPNCGCNCHDVSGSAPQAPLGKRPRTPTFPFHRHQGTDLDRCAWCGAAEDRAVHSERYARKNRHEWVETPPVRTMLVRTMTRPVEGSDDG